MVASTLFLSLVVLGGSEIGRVPAVGAVSETTAESHLVVPTGIAVPLRRHDRVPPTSDLFKRPADALRSASAAPGALRSVGSSTGPLLQDLTARLVCPFGCGRG